MAVHLCSYQHLRVSRCPEALSPQPLGISPLACTDAMFLFCSHPRGWGDLGESCAPARKSRCSSRKSCRSSIPNCSLVRLHSIGCFLGMADEGFSMVRDKPDDTNRGSSERGNLHRRDVDQRQVDLIVLRFVTAERRNTAISLTIRQSALSTVNFQRSCDGSYWHDSPLHLYSL